jgi:predicted TIM-barrel fold metal-dependent hydrolase
MTLHNSIIDIHHHAIFQNHKGILNLPKWSIESDNEAMERLGITGALLSLPISATPEIVQKLNYNLAELASYNEKKHGFLASLPLGNIDAGIKEIDFAIDQLNSDGFILPTNYKGIYLGSNTLVPLLEKLNHKKAIVLVHPTTPSGDNLPDFDRDLSVYEYPLETTRSVMDLIYNDRCNQFPNIKWIIAHAGGTIPYLAYRLSIAAEWNGITQTPELILKSIKSLYFDLALSTAPNVFSCLQNIVDSEHILFGTDFPLRFEAGVQRSIEELHNYAGFSAKDKSNIFTNNAQRIFSRFK